MFSFFLRLVQFVLVSFLTPKASSFAGKLIVFLSIPLPYLKDGIYFTWGALIVNLNLSLTDFCSKGRSLSF